MDSGYLWTALLILALGNFLTRAVPFLFFVRRRPGKIILFVAENFPPIIMTILIFYTLGSVDFRHAPYGLREVSAIAVTAILHLWRGNYLLSIFGGTALYMALVQFGATF